MKEPFPCFDCDDGEYFTHLKPYETTDGKGDRLVIVNVPHLVCNKCGEELFSAEASRMIDDCREKAGVVFGRSPKRINE